MSAREETYGATIFRRRELGDQGVASEPEELLGLSAEEYIERFNVRCYLCDVVQQLLDSRDERPLEFIAEYFIAVTRGSHVVQRSYAFITASLHNRRAFAGALDIIAAAHAPRSAGPVAHPPSPADALQLVQLLCPDLPPPLFGGVCRVLQMDSDTAVPFTVLCAAVGIEVYYAEHLAELRGLFRSSAMPLHQLLLELRSAHPKQRKGQSVYGVQSKLAVLPSELLEEAAQEAVRKRSRRAAACAATLTAAAVALLAVVGVGDAEPLQAAPRTAQRADGAEDLQQALMPHPPPAPAAEEDVPEDTAADSLRIVSPEMFCAAIYRNDRVHAHMAAQHPLLAGSYTAGVDGLVSAVLQAHDQTVLSWRRRRQRRSSAGAGAGRAAAGDDS